MDWYEPTRAAGVLEDLLRRAGRIALEAQPTMESERKGDGSPVTEADRIVDAFLAEALSAAFPGCAVLGEEGARIEGGPRFYVDPIDGTRSYLQRLAYWGPTVCLYDGPELLLGAFYAPVVNEFWFAARGHGAFRDGQLLRIPEPPPPRDQTLFVPSRFHLARNVEWPGRIRALGSAAAHLAHVAAGAGALAIVPRWKRWDVGCGVLLVQEAGGVVSDIQGNPLDRNLGVDDLPFLAGASTALHQFRTE